MSKWDGLNRRKFPRINFPCLIVIRQNESDEPKIMLCHTENVGVGGVCLILRQNVKMFSEIDLELDLMDLNKNIKCKGKVVWNVQRNKESNEKPLYYDIGVEYIDLKSDDKKRVEIVIKQLVKEKKDKLYII